jgi:hypothetical protein
VVVVLIIVCGGFGGKVVKYCVYVSYLHKVSNLEDTFCSTSVNVSFFVDNVMHMLREFTKW